MDADIECGHLRMYFNDTEYHMAADIECGH